LIESIETALRFGKDRINFVPINESGSPSSAEIPFSTGWHCAHCDIDIRPPTPGLFTFNNPLGACPECKGFGNLLRYDESRVIPDPTTSLAGGAVEPWRHPSGEWYQKELLRVSRRRKIDVHRPYAELPETVRRWVYEGDKDFCGIRGFFEEVEGYRCKLHVRVFLSRYRARSPARPATALAPSPRPSPSRWPEERRGGRPPRHRRPAAGSRRSRSPRGGRREVLDRLAAKVSFLRRVGLGYLTVERQMRTLSGGEAQRIALATQLGAQLVGTLYVLDEPSIGLHARDVARLAELCRELAHAGNTVVVVEHDRTFIESADHCVELGPARASKGGRSCSPPPGRVPQGLYAR
jgi:excinuclease ABC subunit A